MTKFETHLGRHIRHLEHLTLFFVRKLDEANLNKRDQKYIESLKRDIGALLAVIPVLHSELDLRKRLGRVPEVDERLKWGIND